MFVMSQENYLYFVKKKKNSKLFFHAKFLSSPQKLNLEEISKLSFDPEITGDRNIFSHRGVFGLPSELKWDHQKRRIILLSHCLFVTVGHFVLNHSKDCSINV